MTKPAVRLYVESLQHPESVCQLLADTEGVKGTVIHEQGVLLEFEGDRRGSSRIESVGRQQRSTDEICRTENGSGRSASCP